MNEEIKATDKTDTWEFISLLKGKRAIGVKWVFNEKLNTKRKVADTKPDWC